MDQTMKTKSAADPPASPPKPTPNPKRKNTGSDQGGRKRVSQACDACRSKKLKCDGIKPACSSCVAQERDCEYGTLTKKRGLPEGYVRGLERLLALLISKDGGGIVNSKFQQALVDRTTRADLIRQWNGEMEEGETLAEAWRSSQLCKAFETLLPELDAPDARAPDSKKLRLEPHAVGIERITQRSPARIEKSSNLLAAQDSGNHDHNTVEAPQPRTADICIPNHSNFSAMEETAHVIAASLTAPSEFNVSSHGRFDRVQVIDPDPSVFLGNVDTQHLDSLQSTLSVPDNLSGVMDDFALDLNFHTMMGMDDLFYEMSNLDYFSGDRDETYRNLGFLLPLDGSDAIGVVNQNFQGNYHSEEWS